MAGVNKEMEDQLKQILWSPNSEEGNTRDKRQQNDKGQTKKVQKHDEQGPSSNVKMKDKQNPRNPSASSSPKRTVARKEPKVADVGFTNKPSTRIDPLNTKEKTPKAQRQNKTLPSDITLGPKEDVGQPIERGIASTPRKEKNVDAEKKKPKKSKMSKKPKNDKKEETEKSADAKGTPKKLEASRVHSPGNHMAKADPDLTPEAQATLESQFVFHLKKKSPKFPLARYYCRLCDYHCDNVTISLRHVKDTRHKRLSLIRATDIMLKSLPDPSEEHSKVVTSLITEIFEKYGLSEKDVKNRNQVVSQLTEVIAPRLPGVTLTVYGSTATGLGLKDSDLNIDLSSEKPAADLSEIFILLRQDKSGLFKQIRSDFSAKIPSILFKAPSLGNVQVQLGINSSFACQTTKLLATYYEIDYRLAVLATTFRYWAKMVKIDEQECGTLPAYVFYLMTVYYLQQCSPPVLPVLHQLKHPPSEGKDQPQVSKDGYFDQIKSLSSVWQCQNRAQVGELWIGLLKFYAVDFHVANHIISLREKGPMHRNEKKWTSKRIAIEDPYMRKRNVAKSVSHPHIYEYIDDRMRAAYLYFGNPQTKNGPLFTHADVDQLQKKLHENLKHSHELNQSSTSSPSPVPSKAQIRSQTPVQEKNKVQRAKSSDLQETVTESSGQSVAGEIDTFVERIGKSVLESAITAASNQLPSQSAETSDTANTRNAVDALGEGVSDMAIADSAPNDKTVPKTKHPAAKSDSEEEGSDESEESSDESDEEESNTKDETDRGLGSSSTCSPTHSKCNGGIKGLYDESLLKGLGEEDFIYRFDEKVLYDGKGPAVMCQICQKEGHLKMSCPEEHLPPLEPLPPMTPEYVQLLDQVLWRVPCDFKPSPREVQGRKDVLNELQDYIREFYADAKLETFGSSSNGFGFRDSDLDLCLTFTNSHPKNMDFVEIIEDLAKKLRRHKGLYNVIAITSAKVPIVKFRHRAYQIEGDISLYNTLGIHNTRMLLMYSQIDSRAEALGYILKVFAKICDIGDASRGSLSSYAYIILVIYFMQQRNPPVLPVLQELHGDTKPETIVDGWNAWYFDNIKQLPQKWAGYQKNKESLAELWVGLLKFFTEEFNFKDYVVCIRQHKPLTRFEKLWNGKGLAVEDPFDLSHNLGGGVSRKMSTFIRKTVRNGCILHGTPLDGVPMQYRTLLDYLFDKELLSDAPPPNDRGCRACGKIGHFAKECPVVIGRKERQARERQEKEIARQLLREAEVQHAQQRKNQVYYSSDVLVSSDREYWVQQDFAANRHRNNSTDSNGAMPIPGSGRTRYQRSYSHGTPPSSSSSANAGSPRVSPYVCVYPYMTAPNNLTNPNAVYGNNSPVGGQFTWQQEQMMQSPQQRHSPHGSMQYGRQQQQQHASYVYPSSPSFYQQHVIPASPSQQQQQQQQGRWHQGSPGHAGHPFYPQHAVQTTGLPSTPSNSKSSQSAKSKHTDRVVHPSPTEGNLEVTISNEMAAGSSKADRNRRRKEVQRKKKSGKQTGGSGNERP